MDALKLGVDPHKDEAALEGLHLLEVKFENYIILCCNLIC